MMVSPNYMRFLQAYEIQVENWQILQRSWTEFAR